jgi:ankyrin repeat protein
MHNSATLLSACEANTGRLPKGVRMSEQRTPASHLPPKPNLRHLKDQAKDRLATGDAPSLAMALFQVARHYGFPSWPKLRDHVLSLPFADSLKQAINLDDLAMVRLLLSEHPELKNAPIGYGGDGPLTWAAECRGTSEPPKGRLDITEWLIANGSDVHEGGDAPLMRASLEGVRTSMMELLVKHGADVNAAWQGVYPIVFAPCETLDPVALDWLLQHGADPNCGKTSEWRSQGRPHPGTALDFVLGTYVRDKDALVQSINLLRNAGGTSQHDELGVIAAICGDSGEIEALLGKDPSVIERRYPSLTIGSTARRTLTLKGGTLLHVAAEFGQAEIAKQLLDAGADINARADTDPQGVGGQTPIFHAATQNEDFGIDVVRLLISRGADLTVRCRLPGHYEHPEEVFIGRVLDYARQFPGSANQTVDLLTRSTTLA